jgi:hypothetical protein
VARSRLKSSRIRFWLVLPAVAAVLALVPLPAWTIDDVYSRGVYPWLQRALTTVSNLVPIAVLDLLIIAAAITIVVRVVFLVGVVRNEGVMDALWEVTKRVIRAAAAFVIVFLFVWGFNYRRVPLASTLGPSPTPSVGVLQSAIADANALASSLRARVASEPDLTFEDIARDLRAPMNAALETLKRPALGTPGRPKYSLILTPFFRLSGTNGMVNPLALESLVDPGLLPIERPFVLAHEWAHLAGHADEAEASAVGWLACMRGGPALAYSASLYLIMEAVGDLPSAARRAAFTRLEAGVRQDLERIADRVRREQEPRVQRAAFKVYDEYLRANQVADGTASYGRALSLILSAPLRDALNDYRSVATPR